MVMIKFIDEYILARLSKKARPIKVAYCRVSTKGQCAEAQKEMITAQHSDVDHYFVEVASTKKSILPKLKHIISYMRPNDIIVISALDRLGRDVMSAMTLLQDLVITRKVKLISLREGVIDLMTAHGQTTAVNALIHAQMERNLISQRSKAGQALRKSQGMLICRPHKIKADMLARAREMRAQGSTFREIAKHLKVSASGIQYALTKGDDRTSPPKRKPLRPCEQLQCPCCDTQTREL